MGGRKKEKSRWQQAVLGLFVLKRDKLQWDRVRLSKRSVPREKKDKGRRGRGFCGSDGLRTGVLREQSNLTAPVLLGDVQGIAVAGAGAGLWPSQRLFWHSQVPFGGFSGHWAGCLLNILRAFQGSRGIRFEVCGKRVYGVAVALNQKGRHGAWARKLGSSLCGAALLQRHAPSTPCASLFPRAHRKRALTPGEKKGRTRRQKTTTHCDVRRSCLP